MKTRLFYVAAVVIVSTLSCQRESLNQATASQKDNATNTGVATAASNNQPLLNAKSAASGTCNPFAYVITLESRTQVNGNWEWVWSVQNPNPGNGKNGTVQNLSHWGMQLGSCINLSSIVGGSYSSDGINWTDFTPSYEVDPSQGCMTSAVLKFDFGTTGSDKSYYRLVVNQNYTAGPIAGYYKSGTNTGCCTFTFIGIASCGGPVEVAERIAR